MLILLEEEKKNIKIELLIKAIYEIYGYDFKDYSMPSLKRRIELFVARKNFSSISALIGKIVHSENFFDQFISHLTVSVTEMFRNPSFYKVFR